MVKWNSGFIWVCLMIGMSGFLSAQSNRYVVHFSDKNYSGYSIDTPEAFLSQRAIDRRINQDIEITAQDLPVSPAYIDSLTAEGFYTYFKTKWLNAVLIEATESDISALTSKTYISKIELVALGTQLTQDQGTSVIVFSSEQPTTSGYTSQNQLNMLGADEMHEEGYTGLGVWVAVFDAGYESVNHSNIFNDLFDQGRLKTTYDFTANNFDVFSSEYSHGSSVLSCIAASSESLTGTAPGADISLYITEDGSTEYRIEEYNWLFAAEQADSSGVDIISSSLGYYDFDDPTMNYTYEDLNGHTSVVTQAASIASDKGILVVTSAGNEGANAWRYVTMPADSEDVIAVGAVDDSNQLASFSSVGPTVDERQKPDVVAKGVRTTVLSGGNEIGVNSGTSFSAPLISGFAASLWQQFPNLTNYELKNLILSSGDMVDNPDNEKGYGLPSYTRIVEGNDDSNDILSIKEVMEDDFTVFPNPVNGNTILVKVERGYNKEQLRLSLFSTNGKLLNRSKFEKVKKGAVIQLDITDENRGIYLLNIQTKSESKSIKVLKY